MLNVQVGVSCRSFPRHVERMSVAPEVVVVSRPLALIALLVDVRAADHQIPHLIAHLPVISHITVHTTTGTEDLQQQHRYSLNHSILNNAIQYNNTMSMLKDRQPSTMFSVCWSMQTETSA